MEKDSKSNAVFLYSAKQARASERTRNMQHPVIIANNNLTQNIYYLIKSTNSHFTHEFIWVILILLMNKIIERYLKKSVEKDLQTKMVFVGGPRQVGKTTFALSYLSKHNEKHPAYLNWDNLLKRTSIMRGEIPDKQKLIVFDEIHKFKRWRDLTKGLFDSYHSKISFLITGSARLDYYRKGGDSLQGRYHYYRLHPFSPLEINKSPSPKDISHILKFGGFPEPFLKGEEKFYRRWQKERLSRVIYDDLRDLENVKEISLIELMLDELPNRVGSPLSIKNLSEVLQVSHESADRWIQILERLYVCYRIPPFGAKRIRAVKKEQKLYLYNWSECSELEKRFENFIASQLLRFCNFIEDTQGYNMELRFIRDTDKREVDFVVLKDKEPLFAAECKTGEKSVSRSCLYFRERTNIKDFYQVHLGKKDCLAGNKMVHVIPVSKFLKLIEEKYIKN